MSCQTWHYCYYYLLLLFVIIIYYEVIASLLGFGGTNGWIVYFIMPGKPLQYIIQACYLAI